MKYRLLIVEDDANYRFAIRESIPWEENGFTIAGEAIHGRQAMEILKKTEVDIILTDVSMPLMNGVELTKRVRAEYPEIQIVVLSAYDDFQFVRDSLKYGAKDYILKQEMKPQEVIETIKKICLDMEAEKTNTAQKERMEHELRLFLRDRQELSAETKEYVSQRIPACVHCAVVLSCEKKNLAEILSVIRQQEDVVYAISDHEGKILIFWKLNGGSRSRIQEQLRALVKRIQELKKDVKLILVSRESSAGLRGIHLMKDIWSLEEVQFWMQEKEVLLYYDYEERLNQRQRAFIYQSDRSLEFFDWKEAEEEFRRMIGQLTSVLPEEKYLTENIHRFVTAFVKDLQHNTLEQRSFYEMLAEKKGIEEKTAFVLGTLKQLWEENRIYTGKSQEIRKALAYIREHLSEELSLGEIASAVGLSENYFSNLFKAEMEQNLTGYINELRIEKAKELMDSTNMKVYEVAEAVGYHNAAYFSTMFRKITKVSVSEYRKSVKNERNR